MGFMVVQKDSDPSREFLMREIDAFLIYISSSHTTGE